MAIATRTTKPLKKTNPNRSIANRPAKRRAPSKPSVLERLLRENLYWIFLSAAALLIGVLLLMGYRAAIASSVFEVKRVSISGATHTDGKKIEEIGRGFAAKTGVWNADLTAIQKEIEEQSWVKTASVSRVLPDGLRIRLTERIPTAVVRLESSGERVWVDDEARVLGEIKSSENPPFDMIGWNEAKDSEAVKKNQERVRLYSQLLNEFRKAETAARITSVDLSDLQDVTVEVNQNGAVKPVKLGNQSYAVRLKSALELLETLESNNSLESVEKIIAYDRTPVVAYKTQIAKQPKRQSENNAPKMTSKRVY